MAECSAQALDTIMSAIVRNQPAIFAVLFRYLAIRSHELLTALRAIAAITMNYVS